MNKIKQLLALAMAILMVISTTTPAVYATNLDSSSFIISREKMAQEQLKYANDYDEIFEVTIDFPEKPIENLFEQYVENVLYESEIKTYANYGEQILKGNEKIFYQKWKEFVQQVAGGQHHMVKFEFSVNEFIENTTFSYEELGISASASSQQVFNAYLKKLFPTGLQELLELLLLDCPYDLYWIDKTKALSLSIQGFNISQDSEGNLYAGTINDGSLCIYMGVSADYSENHMSGTYFMNTSIPEKVNIAKETASKIVEEYAGLSDIQKIAAYKTKICEMVSYNYDALESTRYGDPWQLIWVFDGDESTKVVCEGYSKAFQYLCDLSQFSTGIHCYSVSGTMNGGAHMWNIVRMGNQSYLVDVTNCDAGTIGSPDLLFMTGGTGDPVSGYTIPLGRSEATYRYSNNILNIYDHDILKLAQTKYTSEFTMYLNIDTLNLTYGKDTSIQLLASTGLEDAESSNVSFQWQTEINGVVQNLPGAISSSYEVTNLGLGTHKFRCAGTYQGQQKFSNWAILQVTKEDVYLKQSLKTPYMESYTYSGTSVPAPTKENFETNAAGDLTYTWYSGWKNGTTDGLEKLQSPPIDAGVYTLEIKALPTQYTDEVCFVQQITISPLEIELKSATIQPKIYDGTKDLVVEKVDFSYPANLVKDKDYQVKGYLLNENVGEGNYAFIEVNLFSNEKTRNYVLTDSKLEIPNIKVEKAVYSGFANPIERDCRYGESNEILLDFILKELHHPKVTNVVIDQNFNVFQNSIQLYDSIISYTVRNDESLVGKKGVIWCTIESMNHKDITLKIVVTVSDKAAAQITQIKEFDKVYDRAYVSLNNDALKQYFKATYNSEQVDGTWTVLETIPVDAGNHTLHVQFVPFDTITYKNVTVEFSYIIRQRPFTVQLTSYSNLMTEMLDGAFWLTYSDMQNYFDDPLPMDVEVKGFPEAGASGSFKIMVDNMDAVKRDIIEKSHGNYDITWNLEKTIIVPNGSEIYAKSTSQTTDFRAFMANGIPKISEYMEQCGLKNEADILSAFKRTAHEKLGYDVEGKLYTVEIYHNGINNQEWKQLYNGDVFHDTPMIGISVDHEMMQQQSLVMGYFFDMEKPDNRDAKIQVQTIPNNDATQLINMGGTAVVFVGWKSNKDEADAIKSSIYTIEDGYIKGIKAGQTVDDIIKNIDTKTVYAYTVTGSKLESYDRLGTGCVISLGDFTDKSRLVVIVNGDLDGDGRIATVDLVQLKQSILGITTLNEEAKKAATFNSHSNFGPTTRDLMALKQYLLGIIDSI